MRTSWFQLVLAAGALAVAAQEAPSKRGGLVLQCDDGWSQWRTLVAPALKQAGGRATCFVNNQHVHSGRITFDDLRSLQNDYGWEVGSHAYAHVSAVRFAQQRGARAWSDEQLVPALAELRGAGLAVSDFVFPFNAFTPEVVALVRAQGLRSYRRADPFALAAGLREDGSLPGTSIDLTRYVPVEVLKQWVDLAQARGQLLFLYGHRVLPDDAFVTGRVLEVSPHELVAATDVALPRDEELVLVPDMGRAMPKGSIGGFELAQGRRIRTPAESPDLTRFTAPGATFLIGSSYGTRLSDFTNFVGYAAQRLNFLTVADVVSATGGGR